MTTTMMMTNKNNGAREPAHTQGLPRPQLINNQEPRGTETA
jgi:hypothetical protein